MLRVPPSNSFAFRRSCARSIKFQLKDLEYADAYGTCACDSNIWLAYKAGGKKVDACLVQSGDGDKLSLKSSKDDPTWTPGEPLDACFVQRGGDKLSLTSS